MKRPHTVAAQCVLSRKPCRGGQHGWHIIRPSLFFACFWSLNLFFFLKVCSMKILAPSLTRRRLGVAAAASALVLSLGGVPALAATPADTLVLA